MTTLMLAYGDSIADTLQGGLAGTSLGVWVDYVAASLGFTRVGEGTTAIDPTRAAIYGTPCQYIPGATSVSGINDVNNRLQPYSPDVVLVVLATNDYLNCTNSTYTRATFQTAYAAMLDKINNLPHRPTTRVCIGMTALGTNGAAPYGGTPLWASSNQDAVAQMESAILLSALAKGFTYVPMMDMPGTLLNADHIHPTSVAANQFYAQRVISIIQGTSVSVLPDLQFCCA